LHKRFFKLLTKADIILIFFLIVIIILSSVFILENLSNNSIYAVCELEDRPPKKINLEKNTKIELKNGMALEVKQWKNSSDGIRLPPTNLCQTRMDKKPERYDCMRPKQNHNLFKK